MFRKIIASVSIISLCIPLLLLIGCADGQNFDPIGSHTAKAFAGGSNSSTFGSEPLPEETSGTVLILAPITESPSTFQTTLPTTLPTTSPTTSPSETTTKDETTTTAETTSNTVIVIAPITTRQSVPETTTKPATTKPVTTKAETTTTAETAPNTVIVIAPTTTRQSVPETTADPMTTEITTATTAKPVSVTPVTDNDEKEENNAIESGRSIEVVKAPGEVKRGGKATLAIRGIANAVYSIRVKYSSGYSSAKGLEDRVSDSDGNCSWSWRIGAKTAPGEYDITVFDGVNSYIIKFKVV